jgi:hypothetical protein
MIDVVLSYHANTLTCGVTRFNVQLAEQLGVPHYTLWTWPQVGRPLYSLKASELDAGRVTHLGYAGSYDVLWHDAGRDDISAKADRVFYASDLGCPSTVRGDASRGAYRVLVFGMSHKLALPHFEHLKQQLDRDHPDYSIELSTGVHEGNPWDQALAESTAAMRAIFGSRLRVLGFLADDALARVLQEVDAVAAFYDPAFRANNTSGWTAIAAGKTFFTNRDEQSPTVMPTWAHLVDVLQPAAIGSMIR